MIQYLQNIHVGSVLFTLRGVIADLPALINARLHGCAWSSRNHSANPNWQYTIWQ